MFKLVRVRASCPYQLTNRVYDSLCVGRGKQNDLTTTDRLVSSSHARLFVREGSLQVVDLDSRNGTEVSGQRLVAFEPYTMSHGQVVDFGGRLAFRLEIQSGAELVCISVEEPAEAATAASSGVLRILSLPEGTTPVLDAGRLLALHQLVQRLLEPTAQRHGGRWLEALVSGASRLLKNPDVQLLQLHDGDVRPLHPSPAPVSARAETVAECLKRGRAVAVELINPNELGAVEISATYESSTSGSPFIATACAPILLAGQPWGLLYATGEGGLRGAFDELDVWLLEQLATAVGALLPQVSLAQIVSGHRELYGRILREARALQLGGGSTALGLCLEHLALLANDHEPVFLLAPRGAELRSCALFLHQVGTRSGSPFEAIDAGDLPRDLEGIVGATEGGTLLVGQLDEANQEAQSALESSMRGAYTQRVRFVFGSSYSPEQLVEIHGFDPGFVALLSRHLVRIPLLSERPADMGQIVATFCAELEPHRGVLLSDGARAALADFAPPASLAELRALVAELLASTPQRPLEREHVLAVFGRSLRRAVVSREITRRPLSPGFHACESKGALCPLSPIAQALARFGLFECG